MKIRYFIISVLALLSIISCEKPTDFNLDNKNDPDFEGYIPVAADLFLVEKKVNQLPRLTWRDNAKGEEGYLISKKLGNSNFELIETTKANVEEWFDDTYVDEPSEPIIYGIQAYSSNGESAMVESSPLISYVDVRFEINGLGEVFTTGDEKIPDSVEYGTELFIRAYSGECSLFENWNSQVFEPSHTFLITSDTTIIVNFTADKNNYRILYGINGQGGFSTLPEKSEYRCGETVQMQALPAEGWNFINWEGDVNSNELIQSLRVTREMNVSLNFEKNYFEFNGITVSCKDSEIGKKGYVNNELYESVDRNLLNQRKSTDLSKICVSNVKDMSYLFNLVHFDQNISNWDVSNVTTMEGMFAGASSFNQNISNWDVSKVENMIGMFVWAGSFNQDLSQWCVKNISSEPNEFDDNANAWTLSRPIWGTCPSE